MIKRKKTLLTAIIFLFSLLCFAIGSVCLKPASADTSFVMESGAYVRVVTGESGIRFRARVSKPNENETREYRMLIVPEKLLTDKNIQDDFVNKLKANYPEQASAWDENFWDKTVIPYYDSKVSSYVVSGALGVADNHHNMKFCGIAYYMDGNNFVYADYNNGETVFDNSRSVSLVSSTTLNSGNEFTAEEKNILKNYVSSAIDGDDLAFSSKNAYVGKVGSIINATLNTVSDLNINYEVADENVAKVENGKIVVKNFGETTVTAKIGSEFSASIIVGCPTNEQLLVDATVPDGGINQYYRMGTVAMPADETAPDGFENSLKYVLTPGGVVGSGNYYGYPVAFDKGNKFWTAYADRFSVTDWSDAYVTFKIYNAGTIDIKIGLTMGMKADGNLLLTQSSESVTVAVGEAKEVLFSVKAAMGITENVFNTEAFETGGRFAILSLNKINGVTNDTLADYVQTVYISDFDIVSLSQAQKVRNVLLGKFATAGTSSAGYGQTTPFRYHGGILTDSVSADVVKETDASIKYVMTAEPTTNFSRYAAAIKLTKANLEKIAEIYECTSFENATLSFWVKNEFTTALDVLLFCNIDVSIDDSPLVTKTTVTNNGEWSLVEIDVSLMTEKLNVGHPFSISFYYGTGKTGMSNGATFYLDGFKIYNK